MRCDFKLKGAGRQFDLARFLLRAYFLESTPYLSALCHPESDEGSRSEQLSHPGTTQIGAQFQFKISLLI